MQTHRILGLLAAVSYRMSRLRINFVPVNIVVLVLLVVVAQHGVRMIAEARASKPAAQRLTVSDVLSDRARRQPHIELQGFIDAGVVLESGRKRRGQEQSVRIDEKYAPMVDETGRRGLLIRLPRGWRYASATMTVTGMLRPMPAGIRKALIDAGGTMNRISVNPDYFLAIGEAPATTMQGGSLVLGCSLVLLPWGVVLFRRHVIFRPTPGIRAASAYTAHHCGDVDMRFSGRMTLNGRHAQWFVAVPAAASMTPSEGLTFLSNIDASRSFMGIRTATRVGTWASSYAPDTILNLRLGEQFVGRDVRPAFQLCVDGKFSARRTITLSFSTAAERDQVWLAVERCFAVRQSQAA
jgi:hypothetical protein